MTATVFAKPATIFTNRAINRAKTLLNEDGIELADTPNTFYVPSTSNPGQYYRVTIRYVGPAAREIACTCPYGRRRISPTQTVCTHATAALLHVLRVKES